MCKKRMFDSSDIFILHDVNVQCVNAKKIQVLCLVHCITVPNIRTVLLLPYVLQCYGNNSCGSNKNIHVSKSYAPSKSAEGTR